MIHRTHKIALAAAVVAGIHLLLCIAMESSLAGSPGQSWGWFPMFVIDFPISILFLLFLQGQPQFLVYGLFGSLWWAALTILLGMLVTKSDEN